MLEYETANPGQDFDEKEDAAFDPEKDVSRPSPVVQIAATSTDQPIPSSHSNLVQIKSGSSVSGGIGSGGTAGAPATVAAHMDYESQIPPGSQGSERKKTWLVGPQAMKEGKREAGYSPHGEAKKKAEADLSYQAAPEIEAGAH